MVFKKILSLLKPASHLPEIQDGAVVATTYKYWRMRVFYSMYVGYVFYYFTRKSLTFAMPALMQDLGFDMSDLGIFSSILAVSYGISKFVNGIWADRSNARYFMAFGLILTGVLNILFGCVSSLFLFSLLWGLNGWFQGHGWGPCARLLTHWYSQKERGTWWGAWTTTHGVGGGVIPIATALLAQEFGWRYAMVLPGVLAIAMGFFLINRLRDTPQSLGLPSIEKFNNDYSTQKPHENELTVRELLFQYVLRNKYLWILGISYFFVYVIRSAINDWTVLYLVQVKGYSLIAAGSCVSLFELGGVLGSVVAGWASDKIFASKRSPVNILFSLLVIIPVSLLFFSPAGAFLIDSTLLFLIGFFIFGPQTLIGLAAAELSHKKAGASATGFTGSWAYLGAAAAGYPLIKLTELFGWEVFFMTLGACGVITALLLLPLWSVRTNPKYELNN